MKQQAQALEYATVKQYCKALRVPVIGAHFVRVSEEAVKRAPAPGRRALLRRACPTAKGPEQDGESFTTTWKRRTGG